MQIESFAEFSQRQGQGDDPIAVPAVGRRVWSNGASSADVPGGHHEFFDPPVNDSERLRLQVARQAELVERAREKFHETRQAAYLGGMEGAIPLVQDAKQKHDDLYRELERLQSELRKTPEEQARLQDLAQRRALEQRYLEERGHVQAVIGSIVLCTESESGQPLDREEDN